MNLYRAIRPRIAWHKRLDARVAISVTLIAGVALAAVLAAAGRVITTSSLQRSGGDLRAALQTFDHLVTTRAESAHAQTRLVVDLPIFRALFTVDAPRVHDGHTIDGMADDYCRKLGASFCVVADPQGAWIGAGGSPSRSHAAAAAVGRAVEAAKAGWPTTDVVATDSDLFLIVSEPAMFSNELLAIFTAGYRLDDAAARELALMTHCDVSFVCHDRLCGTSFDQSTGTALATLLADRPRDLGSLDAAPAKRTFAGHTYVGGIYGFAASTDAKLVLLQDWSPTERAVHQLYLVLAGIGEIAFGVALVGAVVFSRRVTRPLRDLASAADQIADGEWGHVVSLQGPAEVQSVADAFNHMTSTIVHWHDEADVRAKRLSETYERFRSVTDSANDAIISVNTLGNILFWNLRAQDVFGYAADEALGRPLAMLLPERHLAAYTGAIGRLATGDGQERGGVIELHGVRRDGTEVPIELSLSAWKVESALCYTAIIRDITERRHAAEALKQRDDDLRQAQKMEAVGRLAGGVAHDFNNLLTAILGYSDLLLEKLPENDPIRRQVAEIQKAGLSAASLTRGLLAFSRKQVLQPAVLNLNAIVSSSENLLRRLIGEDVELIIALEPTLCAVKADPSQIEQLLVNLAVNARDAMPRGGRLTIATVNIDEQTMRQHAPTASGANAALVVRDNGVGMTEDVRVHIFEPFFTTKGAGHGTGLGLASVYGAVKQSGGHVWVESAPSQGSTFTICLPAVAEVPECVQLPVQTDAQLHRGTETILLVEDNDAVREMARETLTGYGYDVIEAANGREALKAAGPLLNRISIVLTDVVMPFMGGAELATRLRTMRPDLKFIFASGYASDPVPGPPASSPGAAFLQKPFSPSVLVRTVREVIDARSAVAIP